MGRGIQYALAMGNVEEQALFRLFVHVDCPIMLLGQDVQMLGITELAELLTRLRFTSSKGSRT